MKAWLLKDFGLENLQLEEVETPTPWPGELLVKVGAVSLNFKDKAIGEVFMYLTWFQSPCSLSPMRPVA